MSTFATMATIWWLLFWTAIGLCIGSFLNVVVYRIPRNQSLREPLWSACPHCRKRICWYDNIPVISFVLLGGRCRACGVPIATRYLVIEVVMALITLMLLDAFFVGQVREGLSNSRFGLTDRLSYDWPIYLAHVILFACLLAMSTIDLEHYWVDVRFTNMVTVAGFALHTVWTPRHGAEWIRPFDTTAVVSVFALGGLGLVWVVLVCQPHEDPEDFGDFVVEDPEPEPEVSIPRMPPRLSQPSRLAGWTTFFLLTALLMALFLEETGYVELRYVGRIWPVLLLFFILILCENTVSRASDQAIIEAIHDERHGARRMVLSELGLLLPAVFFAVMGYWLMRSGEDAPGRISAALHADVQIPWLTSLRAWTPLYGFATAASGYLIAGAIGWCVRIVFTLLFGKEAFGTGDIHLMAAAGCVAGWPIVVIGFFLTCVLALLGWLLSLPFKRTRALPLGPWLSLSFLIVVVLYEPILRLPFVWRAIEATRWLILNNSQPLAIGDLP